MTEIQMLQKEVQELKESVNDLKTEVQSLLNLWQQAKGVVTFVKWSAAVVATCAAAFTYLKDYIK